MPRTFAYLRVSTPGQTTDNQLTEIQAAGFTIEPRRLVTETVSGSIAASQRRGFARLLDRLEAGADSFGPALYMDGICRSGVDAPADADRATRLLARLGRRA